MKNQLWLRLIAVALGGVYLVSGIGKAMDINAFTDIVVQSSNAKMRFFAPLIVGAEITLGFAFLFGIYQKQVALVSICILNFFTIFISIGYALGKVDDCGCFGVLLKINPLWAFIRNMLMLTLSFLLFKRHTNIQKWESWKFGVALALGVITFSITGFEMKNTYTILSIKKGTNLKTTFLWKYLEDNDSKQLIFFFSPICPHCLTTTPKINDYLIKNAVEVVVGLYPDSIKEEDVRKYRDSTKPNFELIAVKSDSLRMVIRANPTVFLIEKGIVQKIYSIEIPNP